MSYRGVIFDLGGVVLGSPLHAIARFERHHGIPEGFVNRLVVASAPDGAWHRLERGELELGPAFFDAFDQECASAGQALDSEAMMAAVGEESQPRPEMLRALERLRELELRVAALTNNWAAEPGQRHRLEERSGDREELRRYFHVFVESSVVGLRKPDPRIYLLTCEQLGVEPRESVFLDDIGTNLKAARTLGMTTIKVVEPRQALLELSEVLGIEL